MLSCKTATGLMEKKHRTRLALVERMQLAFHTAMCDACRHYEQQSGLLERLFKSRETDLGSHELEEEPKELEAKILRKLDAQQK